MVDNMKIGTFIKRKRKEMNLSLRGFADKCAISHTYLSSLEKGIDPRSGKEISPTLETVQKIAIGTNTPLTELLSIIDYIDLNNASAKSRTIANEIDELPEDKRKMMETMLKVFKAEQEESDGNRGNHVSLLDN
jgi:transcriptional regulator with XRE-family HTH domain